MYTNPQQGQDPDEVFALRQAAGLWLKSLRTAAGLSQSELAKLVGVDYYTFISQVEAGRGRVAPGKITVWAEALRQPTREFARTILRFYDPLTYAALFGDDPSGEAVDLPAAKAQSLPSAQENDDLAQRVAKLEAMLASRVKADRRG